MDEWDVWSMQLNTGHARRSLEWWQEAVQRGAYVAAVEVGHDELEKGIVN